MNIRSLSNPLYVDAKDKIEAKKKDIVSEETVDRDANGQQYQGDTPNQRPLSEEELKTVLEKLKNHKGILKHNLKVTLQENNNTRWVLIETQEGQLVKKINEPGLYDFLSKEDGQNFSLVSKTA